MARRQPDPEPKPPPSRRERLRQRLRRVLTRFREAFLVATAVLVTLAIVLGYDATRPPPQRLTQHDIDAAVSRTLATATPRSSFASQAYEVIRPSLVLVQALEVASGGQPGLGTGAGVIIDDTGIILTSLHVVRDAVALRVVFADGTESEAVIVGAQPENDLAILLPKVIPDDMVPATLAGSGGLQVGDEVFAVGHPFGIANSLSAGVVSGLHRNYKSPETGASLSNLIQFDAAANPGNSGGPLVNRDGEVVGIVTALVNPTEQKVFVGIGLAVTIETATGGLGSPPD
jgi:S1-C subfamily serine protease